MTNDSPYVSGVLQHARRGAVSRRWVSACVVGTLAAWASESQCGSQFSVVTTRLRGVTMVCTVFHAMYTYDTRYELVWRVVASSRCDVTLELSTWWLMILHVV